MTKTNNKCGYVATNKKTYTTSLLSQTHDMACYSWSIPAGYSCPMAVYGNGMICDGCYAKINRFGMPNVANAQWVRFKWTKHLLKNDPELWIDTMAGNIEKVCTTGKNAKPYFRWHDSGDLFSIAYINAIIEVCKRTPMVNHWIPTRGWQIDGIPIPINGAWSKALLKLSSLPNVVVRSSALKWNDSAPDTPYGPSSTAYDNDAPDIVDGMITLGGKKHHACPKSQHTDATCESVECRRCWEKEYWSNDDNPNWIVQNVAYYVHGWQGRHQSGKLSENGKNKRRARKDLFTSLTIESISV